MNADNTVVATSPGAILGEMQVRAFQSKPAHELHEHNRSDKPKEPDDSRAPGGASFETAPLNEEGVGRDLIGSH
jgi:hypothetical protein